MLNNKEYPLVSVIMATFNEPASFITSAIHSIVNQTYPNWELIIADDSTKQETIEAIDSFSNDSRITIIRKQHKMGFVPALNEGLTIAKGQYIARMDGDDISMPDRIRIQVSFMEKNPTCDILGGSMDIIDDKDIIMSHRNYPTSSFYIKLWTIIRSPLAHPTVMFRRSIIDHGHYYNPLFAKSEDIEFWLRLRNNGYKILNVKETLLKYRVVGDLGMKRNKEHFSYNYKARKSNISSNNMVLDLCSLFICKLYSIIPSKIISFLYQKENSSKSQ